MYIGALSKNFQLEHVPRSDFLGFQDGCPWSFKKINSDDEIFYISCVPKSVVVLYCPPTVFLSTFAKWLNICSYKMEHLFCDAFVANVHQRLTTTAILN